MTATPPQFEGPSWIIRKLAEDELRYLFRNPPALKQTVPPPLPPQR